MKASRKKVAPRKPVRATPPLKLEDIIRSLVRLNLSLRKEGSGGVRMLLEWGSAGPANDPSPPAAAPAPVTGPRFTKLGADGKPITGKHVAVHDAKTGLTWSAEPLLDGKNMNHADAMQACADLKLCGHTDWRAPTIEELLSIVDYTRCDPAVDSEYFLGPYGWTWSSTPAKAPAGYAWGVYLYDGYSYRGNTGNHGHVRAVRAGQQLGLLG